MSSFDEGGPGIDLDIIKAQIRTSCEERGWTFSQLCKHAGVDPHEVTRAIELGNRGFPETLQVFDRLSAAFCFESQELLEGTAKPANIANRMWLEAKKLLWKFVYKMNVPYSEGNQFEGFLRERLHANVAGTTV